MNIYVDFDDCLCETARYFSKFALEQYKINVPYEKIKFFDLKKSFSLSDEQYEAMMKEGHKPEVLLSYKETSGSVETINSWIDKGYKVSVITGRPSSCYDVSKEWLIQHGLSRVDLFCLNKYGRDNYFKNNKFTLELDDYYKMNFDYAVEDSPAAFKFFDHLKDTKILVFNRPWNKECVLEKNNYRRCKDWKMIRDFVI